MASCGIPVAFLNFGVDMLSIMYEDFISSSVEFLYDYTSMLHIPGSV